MIHVNMVHERSPPASDESPEPAMRPAEERLDAAPAPGRARFGASSSLMSEPSASHSAASRRDNMITMDKDNATRDMASHCQWECRTGVSKLRPWCSGS